MNTSDPLHVPRPTAEARDEELVDELRSVLEQAEGFDQLAERMALLSDPRRLRILFCIHAHPGVRSSDIARATGAHDSTTSHALTLLRRAGWVRTVRTGREVRYELADDFVHDLLHELGSDHLPGVNHPDEPAHRHPHGHAHSHSHEQSHEQSN
jgi:DNA-binding transcriptional ArsR family regulator